MHEWIRPVDRTLPLPDLWHLELVASPSGGRRAYCVIYFEPGEALDERAFERPPDVEDRCPACDVAYVRIPRIAARHRPRVTSDGRLDSRGAPSFEEAQSQPYRPPRQGVASDVE